MARVLLRVFIPAVLISFIGSLPLGSINVTAFHLSADRGIQAATWFVAGSLIAETIYIRLTLSLMDRLMTYPGFVRALHWISFLVIIALAAITLFAAWKKVEDASIIHKAAVANPLITGFTMMAVNPVQIPFWAGWTTVLFEKKWMRACMVDYNVFTMGGVMGALAGSMVFIYAGRLFTAEHHPEGQTINTIIGLLFLSIAILQAWKMIRISGMKIT